jgi:DNA methylase
MAVKFAIEERLDWRKWVTPQLLENKPIHRWYVFPHSFTSELVHALIREWGLGKKDLILDPFAGAGTTLLSAKEMNVPAKGYDISPLAVMATRTKLANYEKKRLENIRSQFEEALMPTKWNGAAKAYPELVEKAFPGRLLGAFDYIARSIDSLSCSQKEREFFRLALLNIIPEYSRAVATGGWLKWVAKTNTSRGLPASINALLDEMLADVGEVKSGSKKSWEIERADARRLPDERPTYSAVITSPPYPNRHDYTRVFGVELMFGFLDWEGTRKIRYQSFHSHPEARPDRPDAKEYSQPVLLIKTLAKIRTKTENERIPKMLEGYFIDTFLCLREIKRVCKNGAHIAFVVGNAQYYGEPVRVDELTAEIGEQAGLTCERIRIARYRGNSAQQMGRYGRNPSRESVVIFRV